MGLAAFLNTALGGLCPGQGARLDLGVEEQLERLGVLGAQTQVVLDVDLGEERLVAQPPGEVVAAGVEAGEVVEQVETAAQDRLRVGVLAVVTLQPAVEVVQLGTDPRLLLLEHRQRDRVGVVGLHELELLVLQLVALLGEHVQLVRLASQEPVELVAEHPGQRLALGWSDSDEAPDINMGDSEVVVTFTVAPKELNAANCLGNEEVAYEVDLGEPLLDRKLIDGQCLPGVEAVTTSRCVPESARYAP
ncbi:MAG: hypothetical protein LH477_10640 [Nocardioides sp.]|nr:hypothetical protein [Nocardioides sp.]